MNFGELIQQLRAARQLTLRGCCAGLGVDPSNWSKMERGVTPPPRDAGILEAWANFFEISGDQRQEFFDLAALARGELPPDVVTDRELLAALPGLFRLLRGSRPEPDDFSKAIEGISLPDQSDQAGIRQRSQGNRLRSQTLRRILPESTPRVH